ncbi:alpha/beta fold hydrolase [Granulicoccus phenolivorans]|uniref:alpha/beta fold hydrolase n=1 Tax=Granulicoccus phenolivorans TaxID=266854 RepID=UPI0004039A0C|nr:alpha/beta fold hydrolase [Granulicoccus phenolivorans]
MIHYTEYGHGTPTVAFLHGVFGQGRNWTSPARALSRHTVLVDAPNHGRSSWTEDFTYISMSDQIAEFLEQWAPIDLVGHSMGAKNAMLIALRHPEMIHKLVLVDSEPVTYPPGRDFDVMIAAMQSMDLDALERRRDAEDWLESQGVHSNAVRQFLLQNLHRDPKTGTWSWHMNLDLLARRMNVVRAFPEVTEEPFTKPTLLIGGAESDYVLPEYDEALYRLFPNAEKILIPGARHWVHSDQPELFTKALKAFLEA